MLQSELRGVQYSKAQHRTHLLSNIQRSKGSVEFKHQNISAVLDDLGKKWIAGYKPRRNTQAALVEAVEAYLTANPEIDGLITNSSPPSVIAWKIEDIVDKAPERKGRPPAGQMARRTTYYDAAARDAANKALGRHGEEFVVQFEKHRLHLVGRPDLAERVEWVAQSRGDGLGYDVLSFNEAGEELCIEVKTTNGSKGTPYYITNWELQTSRQFGRHYRLYRVFDFSSSPRLYTLSPPLEEAVELEAVSWRVWP
jgi:hypothetical protein